MDLQIDDLIDITIKGARVMYTTPDHSEGASRLTTVLHGGTRYVLLADPGAVTIVKPECERGCTDERADAACPQHGVKAYLAGLLASETRVSDERVQEILDGLNGFVTREYDGGTHIANGEAVPCVEVVGCDANVDKAVDWAAEQIGPGSVIANAFGPDIDGLAEVELADGTVLAWVATEKRWSVAVSDDTESEVSGERF